MGVGVGGWMGSGVEGWGGWMAGDKAFKIRDTDKAYCKRRGHINKREKVKYKNRNNGI